MQLDWEHRLPLSGDRKPEPTMTDPLHASDSTCINKTTEYNSISRPRNSCNKKTRKVERQLTVQASTALVAGTHAPQDFPLR